MTALVWRSARGHAASLTGAFLALAIGTALLSALILTLASAADGPAGTRLDAATVTDYAVLASVVTAAVILRKRPAGLARAVE